MQSFSRRKWWSVPNGTRQWHSLASRLAPGAYLHAATDWQEYAEQILAVFAAEPALANTAPGFAPRPDYRPLTKFESRGLKLGHNVWDIIFCRT